MRILTLPLLLVLGSAPNLRSQESPRNDDARRKAFELYDQNKMVDAVPLLERLSEANPSDPIVLEKLAFATFASSSATEDPAERKRLRIRARTLAVRTAELGNRSNLMRVLLDLPEDGGAPPDFSSRKEVDAAMRDGENAFAKGDFKAALTAYSHALEMDPRQYEAALFSGDVYFKQREMGKAGEWFARAIEIDPNRETAYRYWGDALMGEGKPREARDKFIEAIIAEPYNRNPWTGLSQWASRSRVAGGHPRIDTPRAPTQNGDGGNINIVVDPGSERDGSMSWVGYGITRAAWMTSKFKEAFPDVRTYRHSLAEEADALGVVASTVTGLLKGGNLKKDQLAISLANLIKLDEAGLIEAYILLAKPDAGIAEDYPKYRSENREKLRKYLTDFVVGGN